MYRERRSSKFLPGLYNVSYQEILSILNFDSLEVRRIKADTVFLLKMIYNLVDLEFGHFFSFNNINTRGHSLKLNVQYSRINCRQYCFVNRVVPMWNNLLEAIVNYDNVCKFINELNKVNISIYSRGRAYTVT